MARILRGEIWWANLDPIRGREQAGQRPVLILSVDEFNRASGTPIAVPLTSQEPRAGFPFTMEICSVKLPKRSWVKISQVRTLDSARFGSRIAKLSDDEVQTVLDGLDEILGKVRE
ncbi:MAG TPA: type II toxin-antitoxin system PemK/MazF family toxin [Verrucomicrobiae bacterium]|nr:type II toxin-antitoxin system PemK/MazF family toxin [Verrucomicrobiae bacterium]